MGRKHTHTHIGTDTHINTHAVIDINTHIHKAKQKKPKLETKMYKQKTPER